MTKRQMTKIQGGEPGAKGATCGEGALHEGQIREANRARGLLMRPSGYQSLDFVQISEIFSPGERSVHKLHQPTLPKVKK